MNFNAKGIVYVALEWIFILVQITVITLRLYSRSILTRSIGSDDFFIVIAFVEVDRPKCLDHTSAEYSLVQKWWDPNLVP